MYAASDGVASAPAASIRDAMDQGYCHPAGEDPRISAPPVDLRVIDKHVYFCVRPLTAQFATTLSIHVGQSETLSP